MHHTIVALQAVLAGEEHSTQRRRLDRELEHGIRVDMHNRAQKHTIVQNG